MSTADLRPMSLGELLDRTFSLYKHNFPLFAGIMVLPYLVLFLFYAVIAVATAIGIISNRGGAPGTGLPQVSAGVAAGAILAGVVVVIIGLVLYLGLLGAAQAGTIFAVSDLYLSRPTSVRGSLKRVRGKIGCVLGVMGLTGLLVGVGFIALVIPGIILACRTSVAVPAAMLEDLSPTAAIRRSMDLTKGYGMQVFVVFVLVAIGAIIVSAIFQVPLGILIGGGVKPHALPPGLMILQQFVSIVAQVLVAPIGVIAFSLMYYNLRVRKEAFDLQQLMTSIGPTGAPNPAPAD